MTFRLASRSCTDNSPEYHVSHVLSHLHVGKERFKLISKDASLGEILLESSQHLVQLSLVISRMDRFHIIIQIFDTKYGNVPDPLWLTIHCQSSIVKLDLASSSGVMLRDSSCILEPLHKIQDYEYYETPCMLYTRGLCDTLYSPTHIPCLPTAVAHWAWALIPPA